MESIWAQNGVPSASQFVVAIYFAFAFVAARFFLDRFIFRRLAFWLLNRESHMLKINEAAKAKIGKCSESMWKLTYYATVEFCILSSTYHESWFSDLREYFRGWPDQELKRSLKLIYMCQCGFYIYSIAALFTWETRRKDFFVMISHHAVTVILIAYSYMTRFFRIGAVILALHDASDVFLEAAKVFKYSENELGASICFGFFASSWLVLRLIVFPFWVIRSSRLIIKFSLQFFLNEKFSSSEGIVSRYVCLFPLINFWLPLLSYYLCEFLRLSEPYMMMIYYVFNTMLLTLLVFHIYWWILIWSMITRQLKNKGKVGEDIRSDSEDED